MEWSITIANNLAYIIYGLFAAVYYHFTIRVSKIESRVERLQVELHRDHPSKDTLKDVINTLEAKIESTEKHIDKRLDLIQGIIEAKT